MKLQQAYMRKNNPRQYGRQGDLQGQDPVKSEEGITCLTHTWFAESAI